MPVGLLLLAIATVPSARPLPRRGIITAGAAACSAAMVGACPALDGLVLDGSTQEDERELEREEQEEKQMLTDLRKLRKVEQMEEDRLKSIRMAQKNRFARATNREDKDKLGVFMTDESILVEADRREITLVLEQFEEGLVAMRAQKKRVESDKAAMKTSLIDR